MNWKVSSPEDQDAIRAEQNADGFDHLFLTVVDGEHECSIWCWGATQKAADEQAKRVVDPLKFSLDFETLVSTVGYWQAVRLTLTFMGVDFTSAVDGDSSVAIKSNLSNKNRFVVWHNDQGGQEQELGLRHLLDEECDDLRIAKGIDESFELLCNIRKLVEGDITFDQISDHYTQE